MKYEQLKLLTRINAEEADKALKDLSALIRV
jgi:hypothetical protein